LDYKRFDQSAENQGNLIELINGMQDIKLHNAEKQKRWAWERIQARLFRTSMSVLRIEQIQRSGAVFINETKNLLIIFVAAKSVIEGSMTLGMLIAIQYIVSQLNAPLNRLVEFVRSMQETKISLERMNEIHAKDDEENILTCIQASKLGAEHVQLLINKGDYDDLLGMLQTRLDIEVAVSPRRATAVRRSPAATIASTRIGTLIATTALKANGLSKRM